MFVIREWNIIQSTNFTLKSQLSQQSGFRALQNHGKNLKGPFKGGQNRSYSTSTFTFVSGSPDGLGTGGQEPTKDIESILSSISIRPGSLPKPVKVYSNLANLDTIIEIEQENRNKQGVYGFLNTKNNKLYVGSARDITKRFKEHYRGDKTNVRLHNSVQKNTWALFHFIVFEYFDPNLLPEYQMMSRGERVKNVADVEDLYLKAIKPEFLFNISLDATPGPEYKHTPEMAKQISERQKGEKHHMYGKKHTPEALAKISARSKGTNNPRYGVEVSAETKNKLSLSMSKTYFDIYDKEDKFINRYETWGEAADFLGITCKVTFYKYANNGKYAYPKHQYKIVKVPKTKSI